MTRNDPFGTAHEGLRAVLFETALAVGRASVERPARADAISGLVRRALAHLDVHASCEEALVLPALDRLAPELGADLRAGHARLLGLESELTALAERLERAPGFELEPLARRLHRRFLPLVAEHLLHMEFEECAVTRMLAAHAGSGELEALSSALLEAEAPAILSQEARP